MEYKNKTSYMTVKTNPGMTRKVFEQLKTHDWVIGAWVITGNDDIMIWTNSKNYDDTYTHAKAMYNIEGVLHTHSHFVHGGYFSNFKDLTNANGTWVWIRDNKLEDAIPNFKNYSWIANWASIPGEYDYLAYVTGNTLNESMQHVMDMCEETHWQTCTNVPTNTYFNKKYNDSNF